MNSEPSIRNCSASIIHARNTFTRSIVSIVPITKGTNLISRNKREGRYAGTCRYIGHIRGGKTYEFNHCKKPKTRKAQYIAGTRYRDGKYDKKFA